MSSKFQNHPVTGSAGVLACCVPRPDSSCRRAGDPCAPSNYFQEYQTFTNTNAGTFGSRAFRCTCCDRPLDAGVYRFVSLVLLLQAFLKLRSSRTLCSRFLSIAFIEPIHASGGINQLLFSSKERVTCRADFYMQVAFFC